MCVFGPVPSRRLGRSLGVNNIPFKTCSYSCNYCQLGRTNKLSIKRNDYLNPDEIYEIVREKVYSLQKKNEKLDYITIVPDGEPTLDQNLGVTINLLKSLGIKIAVISNSSLIWNDRVKEDLQNADWISFKIDTVINELWKDINRPHGKLELDVILNGIKEFTDNYDGLLATETMLIQNLNDEFNSLIKTTEFISQLPSSKSYLLIPTRPPAEKGIKAPTIGRLIAIYKLFKEKAGDTELIMNNEGIDFSFIDNIEKELLGILSVHPMRQDAVEEYLNKASSDWATIDNLIERELLKSVDYGGTTYYIRNFSRYNYN